MTEETEQPVEYSEEQKKILMQKGLLFEQLLQSERFQTFFQINFDIMQNDDDGIIYLVEVHPDVSAKRMAKMAQAAQPSIVAPSAEETARIISKK